MPEEEQKTTGILLFSVFVAVIGNSFLYGYNIGVVNTPSKIIQTFYNKTYYERAGGNWQDVLNYEMYMEMNGTSPAVNYTGTNPAGNPAVNLPAVLTPESFGVDKSLLYEKWQLELLWSTTVALFVFFGMVGAFASAKVADAVGRKKGMIVITFIMFIAAVLGGIPVAIASPEVLMLSRVLIGLHSGLNISLCPLYLAEISPRKIRGAIGTCHQLAITIGILFAQVMGIRELLGTEDLWPYLFAFNAVPSIFCLCLMPLCPESPRFLLIKKQQEEAAQTALIKFRGTERVEEEMEEMRVEARKSNVAAVQNNFTLKQLMTSPALRLPIIIACLLQITQQWSGINAVMSYSSFIFAQANVPEDSIPYVVVGTGTINVLCTLVAVPLMEKLGRRPLLLWPMCGMVISFIILTIFINLMGKPELAASSSTFAIVCIVAAHTYIIGFALGLGPIPFIVVGEIFRQEPRAVAMSISLAFNWMCNFILMLVFPFMKDGMGEYTYVVFSCVLAAAIVFIFFFVPETKNKTFDEIANSIAFGRAKGEQKSYAFNDETDPMANTKV